MSTPMRERGLAIALEAKDATASCTSSQCGFRQRWLGIRAESVAIESAKCHAERSGHRVRVDYARRVEYAPSHCAGDHRVTLQLAEITA